MITATDLQGVFGWFEFEQLAANIINFLNKKEVAPLLDDGEFTERKKGVLREFYIEDITKDYTLFAMFAASGWLHPNWFPQGTFYVSEGFIERLEERGVLNLIND